MANPSLPAQVPEQCKSDLGTSPDPSGMNPEPPNGITPEQFVASSGWRYAKTMPECPHEYTVLDRSPGGAKTTAMGEIEFEWFVRLIRDKGVLAEWGGQIKPYLRVGGWKYWTMGAPVDETTIINREPVTPETWAELNERISQLD